MPLPCCERIITRCASFSGRIGLPRIPPRSGRLPSTSLMNSTCTLNWKKWSFTRRWKRRPRASAKRLVQESLEEHQEALVLIQDLRSLAPGCPEFDTKFQALVLTVEHHMTEEETAMFPLAEAEVEEDLKDLRDEMLHLKAHLLAS